VAEACVGHMIFCF